MAKNIISTKTQQIEKANSTLFVAVIVASIIISFSAVFIQILWSQSRFNATVIGEKETVRDNLEANLEAIPKLESELAVLENGDDLLSNQGNKNNVAVILDALPSKYDFPAIATSFDALAKRKGVKLTAFTGEDLGDTAVQASPEPAPVEIPIQITVEGNYQNVVDFMKTLEVSIRPLIVRNIELSGSAGKLEANIGLITHYQPAVDLNVTTRTIE